MNPNVQSKDNRRSIHLSKFNEEKTKIIKSGFLLKRSKYLKIWKRRFIVLTNKNVYSFTSDEKIAECTMNLDIKESKKVENSDNELGKLHTFCIVQSQRNYYFQCTDDSERNEWIKSLVLVISNPGIISEQDEIDFRTSPDRTESFMTLK